MFYQLLINFAYPMPIQEIYIIFPFSSITNQPFSIKELPIKPTKRSSADGFLHGCDMPQRRLPEL
jgi:hypothetical protein